MIALLTSDPLHRTVRALIFAVAAIIVAQALFNRPQPRPPTVSVAPTADSKAVEAQAALDAAKILAQVQGGVVPVTAQPAVTVLHDCLGFTAAQCNAILEATRPKTAPVVHVDAKLVAPTPAPTPTPGVFSKEQIATMFDVAKAADAAVLSDPQTHIAVKADLRYEEQPTSKLGALFTPTGSGIGIDVLQRKQLVLIAGAIVHESHVSPVIGAHWKIPHTELSCGPAVYYDHQFKPQISCATYF